MDNRSRPYSCGPLVRLALTVSSAAVLLAGCGPSGPSRTVENYFPLAVGNQWCLARTNPRDTAVIELTDSLILEGLTYYKSPDPGDTNTVHWYVHRNGELRMYSTRIDSTPEDTGSYLLLLREPFDKDSTWPSPNDPRETLRVIDRDFTLNVPAGTFEHCVEVEANIASTYFYAPGVGLAELGPLPDTSYIINYLLLSYVIK
ncbi:MAG TPA: hypothetical protein VMH22_08270 [bacterium]|nr:hypothetical protein [bacterium]